jgi:regulatory protein YycI of two-component signal transduction system YycFG
MKIKWVIVLFIFFLAVILLSFLINKQSQKALSLSEKEISRTEKAENINPSAYLPQVSPAAIVKPPLVKNEITVTEASLIESEEKNTRASKIAAKAVNSEASQNMASSTEVQDSPQAGSTKTGKKPTPKEAQEMNSSGIVMY